MFTCLRVGASVDNPVSTFSVRHISRAPAASVRRAAAVVVLSRWSFDTSTGWYVVVTKTFERYVRAEKSLLPA